MSKQLPGELRYGLHCFQRRYSLTSRGSAVSLCIGINSHKNSKAPFRGFFVMWIFYILFSPTFNKYYIGFTGDTMEERLRKHNSNHKGFTGGAADWKVVYTKLYESEAECRAREMQVKKWKSRRLIEELIATDSTSAY